MQTMAENTNTVKCLPHLMTRNEDRQWARRGAVFHPGHTGDLGFQTKK